MEKKYRIELSVEERQELDNFLQSVSFFFVRLHQRVLFIQVPKSLLPLVFVGSAFYSQNIVALLQSSVFPRQFRHAAL